MQAFAISLSLSDAQLESDYVQTYCVVLQTLRQLLSIDLPSLVNARLLAASMCLSLSEVCITTSTLIIVFVW